MVVRFPNLIKALMSLSFSLGMVIVVSAQEQQIIVEGPITKVGIKGGLNLSNLYKDKLTDENLKVGFNLGFFARIPFSLSFSIQPEILYSSKGASLRYNNLTSQREYCFNLNYVELPVLGIVNLTKKLQVHAGGYVGYLVIANMKDAGESGTMESAIKLNAENFNRFDYGLVGGLGVDLGTFTIAGRYNYGMNEIGDSSDLGGHIISNAKNSTITLYIGFGF